MWSQEIVMSGERDGTQMVRGEHTRPSTHVRDKAELRAIVQDAVLEHTTLLREKIWAELTKEHEDWDQSQVEAEVNRRQPLYAEYNPVVAMAIMATDHRYTSELRRDCHKEAAQYMYPKLKSVEVTMDPHSEAAMARKQELADRIAGLLNLAAEAKRQQEIDGEARDVTPPAPPDPGV